jgi:hypothetical protein
MYITCPNDQVITVTNAAYGREHNYICQGGPIERTGCIEHKSLDIVKSRQVISVKQTACLWVSHKKLQFLF